MNRNQHIQLAAICLLLQTVIGCSKKSDAPMNNEEKNQANDLKQFVIAYQACCDLRQPPTSKEQLFQRISSDREIDFGKYVVIWGIELDAVTDKHNTVLAYAADVPTKGGMVGFVDGSVRRVSAEDFKSLPKASPGNPAGQAADFSPSVKEFCDAFQMQQAKKYREKLVELQGEVWGFESSSDYNPPKTFIDTLFIVAANEPVRVMCIMTESQPWSKYTKGQRITIKGRVPFELAFPHLKSCVVVSAGPTTGFVTKAEDLAKEFKTGVDKANAKYFVPVHALT
jgi:hypothetical protein